MFVYNSDIEEKLVEFYKKMGEKFYNDIMYQERLEYLESHPETRASGYNSRKLKLSFNITLDLKIPKIRNGAKKLNYSVFEKYKRKTRSFNLKIEDLYTGRFYENEICKIMGISSLAQSNKNKCKTDYLNKFYEFSNKQLKGWEILKLDATEFGKKKNKHHYTAYMAWGIKKEGSKKIKKCLGYCTGEGTEVKEGWKLLLTNLKIRMDFSSLKLIVSDMNYGLKTLLSNDELFGKIKKQNCLWHRLDSLTARLKNKNRIERRNIKYDTYKEFGKCKTIIEAKNILNKFREYEYTELNRVTGKLQKNVNKMLSFYYEDNFNFFYDNELLEKYDRKDLFQTMDIESLNSQLKGFLKKFTVFKNLDILTTRIYMFLEKRNYL